MGSCIELQRSRGESLSESQPRSPISFIWHDSWQQEQPIRRTCRYIHSEWCVGWLFLFHHPCLLGLSPVWVHRPARSETRYQYRTVGYTVVSALSALWPLVTPYPAEEVKLRGAWWARVSATRDLSLDNPRPVHQSVSAVYNIFSSSDVAMSSDASDISNSETEPSGVRATARTLAS